MEEQKSTPDLLSLPGTSNMIIIKQHDNNKGTCWSLHTTVTVTDRAEGGAEHHGTLVLLDAPEDEEEGDRGGEEDHQVGEDVQGGGRHPPQPGPCRPLDTRGVS